MQRGDMGPSMNSWSHSDMQESDQTPYLGDNVQVTDYEIIYIQFNEYGKGPNASHIRKLAKVSIYKSYISTYI